MDFLPISILIIAIIIGFVVILEGINKSKVPFYKTIIASVNLIVTVVFFIIYPSVIKNDETFLMAYFYLGIFELAVLFLYILVLFIKMIYANRELTMHTESIKNSPWNTYLILDRKDRVKDISPNLLEDFDIKLEEVLNKKLFDVINKTIRITHINNKLCSNRELEEKLGQLKKINKPNEVLKLEIVYLNSVGDNSIVHMLDQAMFNKFGYYGRFLIGEMKTDFNLLSVEKQLKQTSEALETLQEQFIATLEVSGEGLAFSDIGDKSTWISNILVEQLGFESNNINTEDLLKLMQPEDLNRYLTKINQLTPSDPHMEMKYRLFSKGVYRWYLDKSKKIFLEGNTMIMSSVNQVSTKHFMPTNLQNLDELGDKNDLTLKLVQVIDEERYFHLVVVRLKNLPHINELHGREVGNMAISEYISKLEKSFTSEPNHIFRLTGSTFAFILDDQRKMGILRKGVQGSDDYLNMTMEYGAGKVELEVFAGIAIINTDGYNENELLEAALSALKVAENPKYKGHVCYYGDIK
ncbi:MAG: diguanylate cyclase domain-containing protein [Acholeplasmataceae bacterium]